MIRSKNSVILLETRKDGVRFTTNVLRPLSSDYQSLSNQYEIIQNEIVKKAIEIIGMFLFNDESAR